MQKSWQVRSTGRWGVVGIVVVLVLVILQGASVAASVPAGSGPVMRAVPRTYVALGDSYASGEGVEPFVPETNRSVPENRCHRSTLAYSRLMGGSTVLPPRSESWACSGARIGNFYAGQGQWGEAGQLEQLGPDADLVTLSVGGNDLQFAVVLGTCLLIRSCQRSLGLVSNPLLRHTAQRLETLYRDVLRAASAAQVYVVGYPRFLAAQPSRTCRVAGLEPAEAQWLNAQVVDTDAAVERVVAHIDDPRLHYVSTLTAFTGGEACSGVNPASAFVHGIVPRHPVYSFHPTRAGQARLAREVVAAMSR